MTDLSFFNLNVVGASFLKLMSVLEGNPAQLKDQFHSLLRFQMKALSTLRIAAIAVAFTSTLGAASAAETFRNGQSVQGQSASADAGSRIVDVEATQYANVKYGETVSFVGAGGKKFSWTFNGLDGRSWDLAQFAPAGFASKDYRVYVTKSPLYRR